LRATRTISFASSGSGPSEPGTVGHARLIIACLALTLSPISRMFSGCGPMNTNPERSTSRRSRILGEKAVAGMDRLGRVTSAALMIAECSDSCAERRRLPYPDRFVGELDVLRLGVGFPSGPHRCGSEARGGALDAQRDLAAVGDQDLFEHLGGSEGDECPPFLSSADDDRAPYSTGCVLSENADFAEKVERSGFVFIGPHPENIRLMGDKVSAKQAMIKAGVPTVPGSEGPLPEDAKESCASRARSAIP